MVELFEKNIAETENRSSKGNQLKWRNGDIWYKADYTGYEGLAEYVISHLITNSSLASDEYVLYTLDKVMEKEGTDVDIFLFGFVWKHKGIMTPLANAGRPFPSVWNKCWKRSFVVDNEIKFPKVYSISDLYFHTKAMTLNPKMKMFDTPLYYYNYMRKGSISETQFKGVDVYGKKK